MSTTKVSELTELSTAADNDVLLITDTSDNASKKITKSNLVSGLATTTYVDSQVAGKDALSELSGTLDDITDGSTYVKSTNDFTDADHSKLDGIEASADVTDATNVDAAGAVMESDTTTASMSFVIDEDTMNSNSATKVPTQQSVKAYVDTIAAAGIHYHTAVRVESPSNLNATYDNGTAGVGATLTNAGTQAAIVIDGITLSSADRVLVYNQTNAAHNGIYTVTNVGSASTNWVLTRATDADSYGASDKDSLGEGDAFFVSEGNTGAGELYVMNTSGAITFGTTNITFTVIAETAVYSGGTNIDVSNSTISLDTSSGVNVTGALSLSGTAITATAAELNYVDGVTSNIQTQIDNINTDLVNDTTPQLGGNLDGQSYNITTTGKVGIGTSSPAQMLELSGAAPIIRLTDTGGSNYSEINADYTSGSLQISADTGNTSANSRIMFTLDGGSEKVRIESDGDLHADGDVIAYSTTISDRNLKKDIKPIEDALSKVNKLNGCTFTYTSDNVASAGLIAQEVEEVLPSAVRTKELVFHGEEGKEYKTLQYDQTIGLLVEAIKELTARVEELENK